MVTCPEETDQDGHPQRRPTTVTLLDGHMCGWSPPVGTDLVGLLRPAQISFTMHFNIKLKLTHKVVIRYIKQL